jgi:hypothetical protein
VTNLLGVEQGSPEWLKYTAINLNSAKVRKLLVTNAAGSCIDFLLAIGFMPPGAGVAAGAAAAAAAAAAGGAGGAGAGAGGAGSGCGDAEDWPMLQLHEERTKPPVLRDAAAALSDILQARSGRISRVKEEPNSLKSQFRKQEAARQREALLTQKERKKQELRRIQDDFETRKNDPAWKSRVSAANSKGGVTAARVPGESRNSATGS